MCLNDVLLLGNTVKVKFINSLFQSEIFVTYCVAVCFHRYVSIGYKGASCFLFKK